MGIGHATELPNHKHSLHRHKVNLHMGHTWSVRSGRRTRSIRGALEWRSLKFALCFSKRCCTACSNYCCTFFYLLFLCVCVCFFFFHYPNKEYLTAIFPELGGELRCSLGPILLGVHGWLCPQQVCVPTTLRQLSLVLYARTQPSYAREMACAIYAREEGVSNRSRATKQSNYL